MAEVRERDVQEKRPARLRWPLCIKDRQLSLSFLDSDEMNEMVRYILTPPSLKTIVAPALKIIQRASAASPVLGDCRDLSDI